MHEPINAFDPRGMRSKNRNAEIVAALEGKQTKSTEEWIAAYAEQSDLLLRLVGEYDRVKDQNERHRASLLCFAGRVPSQHFPLATRQGVTSLVSLSPFRLGGVASRVTAL